ncbi:hypothetical protein ACS0TY_026514 [Phlomoides rotata]
MDLPMEYWHPSILKALASALSTLIKIDDRTIHRRMGHYARVLVEVDMKTEPIEKIMYKRCGVCSFANLVFERLPEFCRNCGIVGHSMANCSRGKPFENEVNSGRRRGLRRSSSRNRRSKSRRREFSSNLDQSDHKNLLRHMDDASASAIDHEGQEMEDDVLHGHVEAMQGDMVLALPPIPTRNPFDTLTVDDSSPSDMATLEAKTNSTQDRT